MNPANVYGDQHSTGYQRDVPWAAHAVHGAMAPGSTVRERLPSAS
ncbi:hypothetical protein ACWCQZ_43575 [Streptomyces sp. NPDC002285]